MFRYLHAADLHLDTQPSGLHGYPDEVAQILRDASLRAFDNLVQTAIDRQVAFCLFAGDIYDGAERGARAELSFRAGLRRLADHGIAGFIVHGNHDPVELGWSTVSQWPDEVTVFEPGDPQTSTLEIDGALVAIQGVSYAERATGDNLALRFERHPEATFQIGLLHTNAGGNTDHDPYAPCSLDDLRRTGLDYWALGHIHTRQNLHEGDPWIVYPGNLQGRHPGPAERGAKGAVVVTVDAETTAGLAAEPEFVTLDVIRFDRGVVEIDDIADIGDIHDQLTRTADGRRDDHPGLPLILRVTLTGRGPVHSLLRHDKIRSELIETLRDEGRGSTPIIWWDRLIDQTRPDLDLDRLVDDDEFPGNTLVAIDRIASDEAALDDLFAELPGFRALDVSLPDLSDPALVERARFLAADLLVGDDRP